MLRWSTVREERVENARIDAFLEEVAEVCRKHNLAISHEDRNGAFKIREINDSDVEWLSGSHDCTEVVYAAGVGDYVLATKYSDGDPMDHFCVGFVSEYTHHHRYMIVDNDGNNQRHNGFRRVEKITQDEGRQLVELMPAIGDRRGPSLWWHLAKIRGEVNPPDPCGYVVVQDV